MTLRGYEAIEYAEVNGLDLNKHSDPLEDARVYRAADCDSINGGLEHSEARKVAREDPNLIWIDVESAFNPSALSDKDLRDMIVLAEINLPALKPDDRPALHCKLDQLYRERYRRNASRKPDVETETWFEIESSRRCADDWFGTCERYDSEQAARTKELQIRLGRALNGFECRVVRKVITTEVL